jgi:hypothetical protein
MTSARYVTIELAAEKIGYSPKAIRRKIEEHVWRQGREYRRAPDGRLLVDMQGYEKWVESQNQAA